MDEMFAAGWRVWAWLKLVKTCASSGPNRQVKELPVCVSERAYFAEPGWLETAFDTGPNIRRDVFCLQGYLC